MVPTCQPPAAGAHCRFCHFLFILGIPEDEDMLTPPMAASPCGGLMDSCCSCMVYSCTDTSVCCQGNYLQTCSYELMFLAFINQHYSIKVSGLPFDLMFMKSLAIILKGCFVITFDIQVGFRRSQVWSWLLIGLFKYVLTEVYTPTPAGTTPVHTSGHKQNCQSHDVLLLRRSFAEF